MNRRVFFVGGGGGVFKFRILQDSPTWLRKRKTREIKIGLDDSLHVPTFHFAIK